MLLTASSFGYIAQVVLALAVAVQLGRHRHLSGPKAPPNRAAAALYAVTGVYALLGFVENILPAEHRLVPQYLKSPTAAVLQLVGFQFAYTFPWAGLRARREVRVALGLGLCYLLFEIGYAVHRFALLYEGVAIFRQAWADYLLLSLSIWGVIVLLRQAASVEAITGHRPFAAALLWPRHRGARGARSLALVFLSLFALSVVGVTLFATVGSVELASAMTALGGLLAMFFFALTFLNYSPETTTLLARLTGVALLIVLIVFSAVGWAVTPAMLAAYQPTFHALVSQTLRVEPRAGGYGITPEARPVAMAQGRILALRPGTPARVELPFAFPFGGRAWHELAVYEAGLVTFGATADHIGVFYDPARVPAIMPLLVDMVPIADQPDSGIWVSTTPTEVRITWQALRSPYDARRIYTTALTLYPDGVFTLGYGDLGVEQGQDLERVRSGLRAVGFVTGAGAPMALEGGLITAAVGPGGGLADYYLERRRAIHAPLAPLALLMGAAIVLILLGLPWFLRATVIQPLDALLAGVRRAEYDLQGPTVPVLFNDEIGFLARAFNQLIGRLRASHAQLQAAQGHLEEQVAERTAELLQEIHERREIERVLRANEQELERARDAAEAGARAKSAFLATMSHEIRTPLNAVVGTAELLQETALTPDQHALLRIIGSGGEALLGVINDILDFSRIESGRFELDATPFDLPACLAAAAELIFHGASQKGLDVTTMIEPSLPPAVLGDIGRLRQVLLNLLGNAVKFTEAGAIVLHAEATPLDEDMVLVTVAVRDTGIGILPEQLVHIFDPFVQADSTTARRFGGTGLGLTISRQLVEAMGGTLTATSTAGAGSTFTLHLPLRCVPPQMLPHPAPVTQPRGQRLRVLVAEDNPVNQDVIERMLHRLGHAVRIVGDGQAVVEVVTHAAYDVVLMDLHMPVLDGEAATRAIRQLGSSITQPRIIALTASARKDDCERLLQAGMDDYLAKPVRLVILQQALERVAVVDRPASAVPTSAAALFRWNLLPELQQSLELDHASALATVSQLFDATLAPQLDVVERAVLKDPTALHLAAHRLRGGCLQLGAEALAAIALRIEMDNHGLPPAALIAELRACYQATRDVLSQGEPARDPLFT